MTTKIVSCLCWLVNFDLQKSSQKASDSTHSRSWRWQDRPAKFPAYCGGRGKSKLQLFFSDYLDFYRWWIVEKEKGEKNISGVAGANTPPWPNGSVWYTFLWLCYILQSLHTCIMLPVMWPSHCRYITRLYDLNVQSIILLSEFQFSFQ